MALSITDHLMTSDQTGHSAEWRVAPDGQGAWVVTWLPLRLLDRNRAVTAMTLAELVDSGVAAGSREWPNVQAWATELGLSAEAAADHILTGPTS